RQARWIGGDYTINSLFYGSSPKAKAGPLVSQFLLLGTRSRAQLPGGAPRDMPSDGRIQFGAQNVDQRVEQNRPGLDFMTDWASWLEVQNAARPADGDAFFTGKRQTLVRPLEDRLEAIRSDMSKSLNQLPTDSSQLVLFEGKEFVFLEAVLKQIHFSKSDFHGKLRATQNVAMENCNAIADLAVRARAERDAAGD
ncbi:MAG: hypothetical protein AAGD86_06470, partial [Pseudomonadota bacterium]